MSNFSIRFFNFNVLTMKIFGSLAASRNLMSKFLIGSGIAERPSYASTCKSHRLMLQAQLIAPSASGAFNILPMGMRALDKLCGIIDYEVSHIGCQKVMMSCLGSASLWKKSKRWELFGDELIKLKVSNTEHCLNPTHEEAVTDMVASSGLTPLSNLPLKIYQISMKFRDEPRPRFGLLRCREFLMKDLYTFDEDIEHAKKTYNEVCTAYEMIFSRLDLDYIKAKSLCGNIGGDISHEYLISAEIGEDKVCIGKDGAAWNVQYEENDVDTAGATISNAIEIGHAFLLGDRYSKLFGAEVQQQDGKRATLQMGCYGLGVTRILACCIESLSSENEIRWPYAIAPFKICIIPPKRGSKEHQRIGSMETILYSDLTNIPALAGDVVIDDRTNRTIGKRLFDAKLIGYPVVIVIGKHVLDEDPMVEVIFQNKSQVLIVPVSGVVEAITQEFR